MDYGENTVFITGQAKPSQDDVICITYKLFFVSLVVDRQTDIILDATCNAIENVTKDFIKSFLIGKSLINEIDGIVLTIRNRYFGLVQKPLIIALKDAHNKYVMIKNNKKANVLTD